MYYFIQIRKLERILENGKYAWGTECKSHPEWFKTAFSTHASED